MILWLCIARCLSSREVGCEFFVLWIGESIEGHGFAVKILDIQCNTSMICRLEREFLYRYDIAFMYIFAISSIRDSQNASALADVLQLWKPILWMSIGSEH